MVNLVDGYKLDHRRQYPEDIEKSYTYLCARSSRVPQVKKVVFFGANYLIKHYLIERWNNEFFKKDKAEVIKNFTDEVNHYLGPNTITTQHLEDLHDLGYLPLSIKALPEGSLVPIQTPMMTWTETNPKFTWLSGYIENVVSVVIWPMCTSATTAYLYRNLMRKYYKSTCTTYDMLPFAGHDFSFRGMMGTEAPVMSGAAHALSFYGSDTFPVIGFMRKYYNADMESGSIIHSVPATEHSVHCSFGEGIEGDKAYMRHILDTYNNGETVSVVCDTYNIWEFLKMIKEHFREEILARPGKIVFRPDSGLPEDIICGTIKPQSEYAEEESKGVLRILTEIFGGSYNSRGFFQLNPSVGLIYGDAITLDRCKTILSRMKDMKYASDNIVFGIGSFTYQGALSSDAIITRDTYGFAIKRTSVVRKGERMALMKDPITGSGKRSSKGLMMVNSSLSFRDDVTEAEEAKGALRKIFEDGKVVLDTSLSEIRTRLHGSKTL